MFFHPARTLNYLQHTEEANESRDHRGAYRSATVRSLCSVCAEEAKGPPCPRCGAFRCQRHRMPEGARCEYCEGAYALLEEDRRRHPFAVWDVLLVHGLTWIPLALVARWLINRPGATWTILAVSCAACLTPVLVTFCRRQRLRGRFMAERQDGPRMVLKAASPDGDPKPVWDELSVAAFMMSLLFFLPILPTVGLMTGIVGSATWGTRAGRRGRWLSRSAIAIGGCATTFQLYVLYELLSRHYIRDAFKFVAMVLGESSASGSGTY